MEANISHGITSGGLSSSSIMSPAIPAMYYWFSFDGKKNNYLLESRFCKALGVARRMLTSKYQTEAYVHIGVRMAQANEFKAVTALALTRLPCQRERIQVWTEMALMMIKNDNLTEVLSLAERIFDGSDIGNEKILMIVQALINKGFFDMAIKVTGVLHESDRDKAWVQIASGFAERGEYGKALEISERISLGSCYRNEALVSIARALIKVKQLEKAYDVVQRIDDLYEKSKHLKSIAESYAEAHQFSEAIVIAEKIEKHILDRAQALKGIAKEMAKLGLVPEAFAVVETRMAGCSSHSSYIDLMSIVLELIPDHVAEALEIIDKISKNDSPSESRNLALGAIAVKFIEVGLYDIAIHVAEQSNCDTVWKQMEIAMIKSGLFSDAGTICSKINDESKARIVGKLRGESLPDEVRRMHDETSKDARVIAEEMAKAGRFVEALSVMNTMPRLSDSADRVSVCTCIAKELAKSGRGGEAVTIVYREMPHFYGYYRDALIDIVDEVVKIGHTQEEISAVEEAVLDIRTSLDDGDRSIVVDQIRSNKIKIELLFEAIKIAERTCSGDGLNNHNALLEIAIRLFDAKRLDEEFFLFFASSRDDLQKKTDLIMFISAKLLLEYGHLEEAIAVVEKILTYEDKRVGLLADIAAKMTDTSLLEQVSCATEGIYNLEIRDIIDLKIVDSIIGDVT